jgi:hypothetical protein
MDKVVLSGVEFHGRLLAAMVVSEACMKPAVRCGACKERVTAVGVAACMRKSHGWQCRGVYCRVLTVYQAACCMEVHSRCCGSGVHCVLLWLCLHNATPSMHLWLAATASCVH